MPAGGGSALDLACATACLTLDLACGRWLGAGRRTSGGATRRGDGVPESAPCLRAPGGAMRMRRRGWRDRRRRGGGRCGGEEGHLAYCAHWRHIDNTYGWFGDDPRNIRFALSTDGMNPYGNMSTSHSAWPILLSIMNLLPWLYNKRKYIMLSTLVFGPKQPEN